MRVRGVAVSLGIAALTHAAVDAGCAVLLFGGVTSGRIAPAAVIPAFLGYALLAFGMQPIIGYAADRSGAYRAAAIGGALATALAVGVALVPGALVPAIVLAGLGNAVFHVGAGVFSLRATPGRALAPGLFVAPGAAGLAAGTVIGRAGAAEWPIVLALITLAAALAVAFGTEDARTAYARVPATPVAVDGLGRLLLLVLLVVATRSFVGTALAFPWRSEPWMLPALVSAVVAGKAIGGALADRYGRVRVGVGTLLLATPLLVLGAQSQVAGIAGMLAFNVTMPITLVALADGMPAQPGTAFGLTCIALVAGAFPSLVGVATASSPPVITAALVVLSAGLLYVALAPTGAYARIELVAGGTVSEGSAS